MLTRLLPLWFNELSKIREFSIEIKDELASEDVVGAISNGLGRFSKFSLKSVGPVESRDCGFRCIGGGPGYAHQMAYAMLTWQVPVEDTLRWKVVDA